MVNLIVFLIVFGVLVFVHEFGHFFAAKKVKVRVEKFCLGFGPVIFQRKKNETEYSICVIPFGGYIKLAGDSLEEYKGNNDEYLAKRPLERGLIVFCGPLLNYILGFLCFWLIFFAGYPTLSAKVGSLLDGFGAKQAGAQVGDKIIALDGKPIDSWEQMQEIIQAKKENATVNAVVLRDNKEYALNIKIKEKEVNGPMGERRSVGLIGITPQEDFIWKRHGLVESLSLAIKKVRDLTTVTYKGFWRLVTGKLSLRESVTGPLGIFYVTSQAVSAGPIAVLHLVAILNIILAIFNLLPFPVLDGGHILLLLIEKIRGHPLNQRAERILSQAGFTAIISFALIVTYNDLVRLFADKMPHIIK